MKIQLTIEYEEDGDLAQALTEAGLPIDIPTMSKVLQQHFDFLARNLHGEELRDAVEHYKP